MVVTPDDAVASRVPVVYRRKLKLKAKLKQN
jgi:hypothetical protein